MSNISTRHNVNIFTAGKSQPLTGQRLAKIGFKKSKNQTNPLKSVCVSVPPIEMEACWDEAYIPQFQKIVQTALENAQDGIIRSLYESSGGNLTSVSNEEISIPACLAFIESEMNGGRMTKEMIVAWFNSELRDNLTVTFADKLGFSELTPENQATIDKHVNAYRDLFASLAGGKTILEEKQILSLKRALELTSGENEIEEKLTARLDGMLKKEKIEDLLEL